MLKIFPLHFVKLVYVSQDNLYRVGKVANDVNMVNPCPCIPVLGKLKRTKLHDNIRIHSDHRFICTQLHDLLKKVKMYLI
jgi:hypothetical protein